MRTYLPIILLAALSIVIYVMIDSQFTRNNVKGSPAKFEGICGVENSPRNGQPIVEPGKTIFWNYCAACHNVNMRDDLTGPALRGSITRWQNDTLGMLAYLKNPGQYYKHKPKKRMNDLHKAFGNTSKPDMEELTMVQLKSIIDYIELKY